MDCMHCTKAMHSELFMFNNFKVLISFCHLEVLIIHILIRFHSC